MTATQDDTIAELQRANAELRRERDAALSEKAALAEELAARTAELAQRNSEYGERIEHQAATIDVLKAMSASPGDPQPVFDLIARQAANLCNVPTAAVATFDGTMMHLAPTDEFELRCRRLRGPVSTAGGARLLDGPRNPEPTG